jgi:hypothetical protein
MQKMQNAKNAGFASLKQCTKCKYKTMRRLQVANNAASANYDSCRICKLSTIDTAAQYNAAVVSI